jgi:ferredoxin
MSTTELQHMPLSAAWLCQDCNSVGNCAKQCPACASSVLMSLATVLDGRSGEVEEVQAVEYDSTELSHYATSLPVPATRQD